MIIRVPSNRGITPMAQQSSARIASFRDSGFRLLAGGDASTQTPLTENSSTRLRTISFPRGLGESSVAPRASPRASYPTASARLID